MFAGLYNDLARLLYSNGFSLNQDGSSIFMRMLALPLLIRICHQHQY
jgi:hypothetical protein